MSRIMRLLSLKIHLFIQSVKELIHLRQESCPPSPIEFKEPRSVLINGCSEVVY